MLGQRVEQKENQDPINSINNGNNNINTKNPANKQFVEKTAVETSRANMINNSNRSQKDNSIYQQNYTPYKEQESDQNDDLLEQSNEKFNNMASINNKISTEKKRRSDTKMLQVPNSGSALRKRDLGLNELNTVEPENYDSQDMEINMIDSDVNTEENMFRGQNVNNMAANNMRTGNPRFQNNLPQDQQLFNDGYEIEMTENDNMEYSEYNMRQDDNMNEEIQNYGEDDDENAGDNVLPDQMDEIWKDLPLINPLLYKPASKPPVIREGDWLCPDSTCSSKFCFLI